MRIYIYTLKHPQTKDVRYVGKTNNIKNRLFNHLSNAKSRRAHVYSWIKDLLDLGLKPVMEVIDECDSSEWVEKEKYWIAFYKEHGCSLCNMTEGGIAGFGGFVNVDEKLRQVQKAIALLNNGLSQTECEKQSGLYKGFLTQLRGGKIPYLKPFNIQVPKSSYNGHIEKLKKYSFKKGRANPHKGVPVALW